MAAPKLFILDSNAYFRLAVSIHPLLGRAFGKSKEEQYVLRVIPQLDIEYNRNPRLQHKFHWVSQKKYANNRKDEKLTVVRKQQAQVEQARSFILQTEKDLGCSLSLVDATALAIGFVKQQPVVTDDNDMCRVAVELGIEFWSLLQLLKLMLDQGHINQDKVKEVVQFLDYENDLPCGRTKFIQQFKQFFGADPFE